MKGAAASGARPDGRRPDAPTAVTMPVTGRPGNGSPGYGQPPHAYSRLARRLPPIYPGTRWPRGPMARLRRRAVSLAAPLRSRWRRSLQLRVVGTTLAVSIAVVAVLGFFLMQQISDGLLQNTEKNAISQTLNGQNQALKNFSMSRAPTSSGEAYHLTQVAVGGLQVGSGPSSDYSVAIYASPGQVHLPRYRKLFFSGWTFATVPAALKRKVASVQAHNHDSQPYQQFTTIAGGVPALAVGVPLGRYYQLYYVFPLTNDLINLQRVQQTLIGGGLALVGLLALIASLVTRWVVIPVRRAAESAQRLSAGDLAERMQVHGTDDLAALATSFNEMAASLQDKLGELQGLSQVQRQFVSDVSHELRTPLTTIRIAADVLYAAKDALDGAAARSAELLQGQLERFESLLADLLEISRYDANAATLDAEPVDVCDLVRRSADVAQQLAERRGSRIEFRLPAQRCVAEADRRRVERILRNLLINAVEHGEGRDVIATVASDSDTVAVAVRDYGVGLRPGEEQLVFDRFWRADPARARHSGGTGLGLSIALEDARLHGGWLEAWGEYGRGSVFRLTLPRVAGGRLEGSPLPLGPDEAEITVDLGALATAGLRATLARINGPERPGGERADDT